MSEYSEGQSAFRIGQMLSREAALDKSLSAERRNQKTNSALEFFDQAIEKGYDEAQVFASRASILSDLNYNIDALNYYNVAIAKNPEKASYFYDRALTKQSIFDYEGSLADFEEAIRLSKLDNEDTRYWNEYAKQTGFKSATQGYELDMQFLLQESEGLGKRIEILHEEKLKTIKRRK